ncbi:SDR family NAD(P)-dependent oxidoreductase [Paenibacillus agricola]|uniref:3-oxoacyl-ACP reductase FabG n=1 Tax=Paenibacillus agricola TaxID=2716264 RepID=A0ABX0IYL1_9BACL|nr:3-oxoacyl-ACP reductase family protein [Paenibacillus agricola]NHN28518.1 3-oxoacyl-ACP reductase FabG [Paenibacillus agricola]
MTINLTHKIALVTGGNNGIGLAISETLAKAGAKVAINYLKDKEAAARAVESIRAAGGVAEAFQADVTDLQQIDQMLAEVREKLGPIDILVNNAGHMIKRLPNMEMDEEHYGKVMDVNFKSCVFVSKAATSDMIAAGGGAIVNVSSVAAHNGGGPGASVYAASKAAMISYSKGFAKEVAKHGIRVNCLSPGFIGQTAFHATFTTDAARESTISSIPLGREGTPQDVADSVLFFVSDLSAYLTGETIEINGGMFMK